MKYYCILIFICFLHKINANNNCEPDQVFCGENASVKCLSKEWVCDQSIDCGNGADEIDCPVKSCTNIEFQCASKTQCIPKQLQCDGEVQCLDGSDEDKKICDKFIKICNNITEFDCDGDLNICLPLSKVCDGKNDCPRWQDERPGGNAANCQRNDCRLTKNGGCSHECINRYSEIICSCPNGMHLKKDKKTCIDDNECTLYPPKCAQECTNTQESFKCSCYKGYEIDPNDSRNCIASDNRQFVFSSQNNLINKITFQNHLNNTLETFNSDTNVINFVIDVSDKNILYVLNSEVKENSSTCSIDKVKLVELKFKYQKQLVQITNKRCYGMTYDWLRKCIYWTGINPPVIYMTNITSGITSVLIKNKGLMSPRHITIDPFSSKLYWIDTKTNVSTNHISSKNQPIIQSANIIQLYSSNPIINTIHHYQLNSPTSLQFDFISNRLYWSDVNPGIIAFLQLTPPNLYKPIYRTKLILPYSIVVFENKVFWSDWRQNAILSIDKTTGQYWQLITESIRPHNIVVLSTVTQPLQNDKYNSLAFSCMNLISKHTRSLLSPCQYMCIPGSPCSGQLCQYKCTCPIGYSFNMHGKLCVDETIAQQFPHNVNRKPIVIGVCVTMVLVVLASIIASLICYFRYRNDKYGVLEKNNRFKTCLFQRNQITYNDIGKRKDKVLFIFNHSNSYSSQSRISLSEIVQNDSISMVSHGNNDGRF